MVVAAAASVVDEYLGLPSRLHFGKTYYGDFKIYLVTRVFRKMCRIWMNLAEIGLKWGQKARKSYYHVGTSAVHSFFVHGNKIEYQLKAIVTIRDFSL